MRLPFVCVAVMCHVALSIDSHGENDPDAPQRITILRDLSYQEGPSNHWKLDLAYGKEPSIKPRAAIVIIHGGGWIEGDKSSFSTRKYHVPGNIVDFADLGYVAISINYRLSGEAPFPAALEDCRTAVRWLRAHAKEYNLDPNRIGAFGNSAGGHLALLLALTDQDSQRDREGSNPDKSSRVRAAVSDSGPVDLIDQYQRNRLRTVVSGFMGGPPAGDRVSLYRKASPINQIAEVKTPLLLIYGGADAQVPIAAADRFVTALDRAGFEDVSYLRLAQVDHCPYSLVRIQYLRSVVNDFFDRTLRGAEAAVQDRRFGNAR